MSSTPRRNDHIEVVIVDDHPAIRDAIRDAVDGTMDMEVVAETESADTAFRHIEKHEPDVATVDLSLSDGHGFELLENIRAQHPDVRVVVFSMYDEDVYAERAIRAGASGYLMKKAPTPALLEAIRRVNDGEVYLSRRMSSRVLNKVVQGQTSEASFPIDELTDRELQVFQMLGRGLSLEEVEDRLNLARKTVETYRRRAKEKLGFDTVSELLAYAVQWTLGQESEGGQRERAPENESAPESV